jgi:hypothetical protein
VETSPEGFCKTCFGTGVVGGYDKYGFRTEVVDVTAPVRTVNVVPNPGIDGEQTRPVRFSLGKNAIYGYVEADVRLYPNIAKLDALKADYSVMPTHQVLLFIKRDTESSFVTLTDEALVERLDAKSITFRFEFSRQGPTAPLPQLSHLIFRYQQLPDSAVVVKADVPRTPESLTLAELGVFESFSARNMWLDGTLKAISTEDFFHQIDTGRRWKVTETNVVRPLGQTLAWDLVTRLSQNFDAYEQVP